MDPVRLSLDPLVDCTTNTSRHVAGPQIPGTVVSHKVCDSHCMRKGVDLVVRKAASNLSKCKTIHSYCPPSQHIVPQLLYSTRVVNNLTHRMSPGQGNFSSSAPNGLKNGLLALPGKSPLKVKNSLSKDKVRGVVYRCAK